MVVGVGLPVRDRIELLEGLAPAGLEHTQQQLVLTRVVARGLLERNPVPGMIGQAHPVAVRLDARVSLTELTRGRRADAGQQPAFRVARGYVRTDRRFQHAEVVAMMKDPDLDTVPFLTIGGLRF